MFYPLRSIHSYVHHNRIGVLLEFGLETDFAERTDEFKQMAGDIALHITAIAPADVDELLAQPFVKKPENTVAELIDEVAAQLRERVAIIRFVRWQAQFPEREDAEPQPPEPPAVAVGLRVIR